MALQHRPQAMGGLQGTIAALQSATSYNEMMQRAKLQQFAGLSNTLTGLMRMKADESLAREGWERKESLAREGWERQDERQKVSQTYELERMRKEYELRQKAGLNAYSLETTGKTLDEIAAEAGRYKIPLSQYRQELQQQREYEIQLRRARQDWVNRGGDPDVFDAEQQERKRQDVHRLAVETAQSMTVGELNDAYDEQGYEFFQRQHESLQRQYLENETEFRLSVAGKQKLDEIGIKEQNILDNDEFTDEDKRGYLAHLERQRQAIRGVRLIKPPEPPPPHVQMQKETARGDQLEGFKDLPNAKYHLYGRGSQGNWQKLDDLTPKEGEKEIEQAVPWHLLPLNEQSTFMKDNVPEANLDGIPYSPEGKADYARKLYERLKAAPAPPATSTSAAGEVQLGPKNPTEAAIANGLAQNENPQAIAAQLMRYGFSQERAIAEVQSVAEKMRAAGRQTVENVQHGASQNRRMEPEVEAMLQTAGNFPEAAGELVASAEVEREYTDSSGKKGKTNIPSQKMFEKLLDAKRTSEPQRAAVVAILRDQLDALPLEPLPLTDNGKPDVDKLKVGRLYQLVNYEDDRKVVLLARWLGRVKGFKKIRQVQ